MKKLLFLGTLASVVSPFIAFAAIEHPTCHIYSNATLAAPQVDIQEPYDWSDRDDIEGLFVNHGFDSQGYKNVTGIDEGAIYSNAVTVYGGRRRGGQLEYFAYTIIQIRQKDSATEVGYRILDKGVSNEGEPYYSFFEKALRISYEQAISAIERCQIVPNENS